MFTKENFLATCGGMAELNLTTDFPWFGAFKDGELENGGCFVGMGLSSTEEAFACFSLGPSGELEIPFYSDPEGCFPILFTHMMELIGWLP